MAAKRGQTAQQEHAADVATYVAAGGEESVQRVITAVFSVTKKLDQWYVRQFADLALTQDGWALFSAAVRESNVVESDTLRGLSDSERHELARLLEIVIAGLDDIDA